MTDFIFRDHGSVTILTPKTQAAKDWVEEHIADDSMWFARGIVVEPRYVSGIIAGIQQDGLEVN